MKCDYITWKTRLIVLFTQWIFGSAGDWSQSFALARQGPYHLSHVPCSFCAFVGFSQLESQTKFAQADLWLRFFYFCLMRSWDNGLKSPHLAPLIALSMFYLTFYVLKGYELNAMCLPCAKHWGRKKIKIQVQPADNEFVIW